MGQVKYFEIVRDIIELNVQAIAEERKISRLDAYKKVVDHLVNNSKEWMSGRQPNIPYQDPLCRIAYLYGIVPANANLVELVFKKDLELKNHMDNLYHEKGQIDICAFGGGPGTELLGIAKLVENRPYDNQVILKFLLIDFVKEWIDSWQLIQRQIEFRFRYNVSKNPGDWPFMLNGNFCPIDITQTTCFGNWGSLFGQDIYIFSYFISEIFDHWKPFQEIASKMAECAPSGSKFVFIDRDERKWKIKIDELAKELGITLSQFRFPLRHYMSDDEQLDDLGQIRLDVGRSPSAP